jgi:hypothetical protein
MSRTRPRGTKPVLVDSYRSALLSCPRPDSCSMAMTWPIATRLLPNRRQTGPVVCTTEQGVWRFALSGQSRKPPGARKKALFATLEFRSESGMESASALKPYSNQSTDKDGVADGCRVAELGHTLVPARSARPSDFHAAQALLPGSPDANAVDDSRCERHDAAAGFKPGAAEFKQMCRWFKSMCRAPTEPGYSQFSAPPVWYSVTRVSKKLRSFFRSIISLIHGNGFSS